MFGTNGYRVLVVSRRQMLALMHRHHSGACLTSAKSTISCVPTTTTTVKVRNVVNFVKIYKSSKLTDIIIHVIVFDSI